MEIGTEEFEHGRKMRRRFYWITSAFGTLLYILVMFVLLTLPGVEPREKIWVLSPLALFLGTSLAIGSWKFWTGSAPISLRPYGRLVGVVLVLEFLDCMMVIMAQVFIILRKQ